VKEIGRLAMRVEGTMWNAYYAMPDTMEDAIFLGSIRAVFVATSERKHAFLAVMCEAVADLIEAKTGERPTWPEPHGVPAPEHERGGNA
jgi:hypothetical protein